MAEVVECLPSKCEVPPKKKKKIDSNYKISFLFFFFFPICLPFMYDSEEVPYQPSSWKRGSFILVENSINNVLFVVLVFVLRPGPAI
jgi:hypothetical protein